MAEIEKTIGGDRLGSGNKMKTYLHNYERSTHDLGNVVRTTMAPGVLYPVWKELCQNGDTWELDLATLVRTVPAIGPLFGTYKMQIDVFEVPIRLYNGVLHNNWTRIGMDMAKVKMPKVIMQGLWIDHDSQTFEDFNTYQISSSSLWAYCGLRGIGDVVNATSNEHKITREVQCVPILAYWDIFKNYYSNKQEKKAFVIDVKTTQNEAALLQKATQWLNIRNRLTQRKLKFAETSATTTPVRNNQVKFEEQPRVDNQTFTFEWNNNIVLGMTNGPVAILMDTTDPTNIFGTTIGDNTYNTILENDNNSITVQFKNLTATTQTTWLLIGLEWNTANNEKGTIDIKDFDLDNIDKMRMEILKSSDLGTTFYINSANQGNGLYPYKAIYDITTQYHSHSRYKMVGLGLKTYQSDLYNNWLSSEWIDGINGINQITAVDTSQGSFNIDALNLAHKVYNMLNRIAVSGGTYQDWQEAVYGEETTRMAESPIFCGELACNIQFEEVVSTADTQTDAAGDQPLGSLAGKGVVTNVRGGKVDIHIKEPSYIMCIASITPLIDYNQGNDWDIMELESLNDIHKPALDQIGFQNLMLEQAVWWGKYYDMQDNKWKDNAVGKIPAWINYMTNVNKTYGDFAKDNELGFMCLNRRYEYGQSLFNGTSQVIPVRDFTTYINPTKYNNQFADTSLDAQNFWVQIGFNAIARRKMSAKIIPNL